MRKAFTLIELLVCIAILAILMAILFPTFNKIKVQAYNSVSLSNIKQLAIAWKSYSEDYDDVLMRNVDPNYSHWFGDNKGSVLDPYVKIKNLKDPMSRRINAPDYWVGYGYNAVFLSPFDDDNNPIPINYSSIQNPSETLIFAPVAGIFTVNNKEGLFAISTIYPTSFGYPTFHARYNGKSPVVFSDLHAQNFIPNYLNVSAKYKNYEIGFIDKDGMPHTDELFDLD